MDLKNYFDELGVYPKLGTYQYRCCWHRLQPCLGTYVWLVCQESGQRVNTINTNFTILLFKNERLPAALEQGQLTIRLDILTWIIIDELQREKFSTDPAHVEKSQIEANVFAETEIKTNTTRTRISWRHRLRWIMVIT